MIAQILQSRKNLIALATLGSVVMILGAWGFEHIGDMAPCKLCYWQRYGHYLAFVAGVAAFFVPLSLLIVIGGLGALSSSVVAVYHTGVERKWWEGPNSCTAGSVEGLSTEELLNQIMTAPMVRCDEIPWDIFGISMANLNILGSFVISVIWFMALRRTA